MKSRSAPSDPLIKALHQWKKDQAIISLTIEEMEEEAKGKNLISEQKVDGQSAILDYKEGSQARFGSLGGMIMWDLPLCDDLEKTLKAKMIHQIKAVGEMAGYADLSSERDAIADDRAARQTYKAANDAVLADDAVVRDLNEIVDFGAASDTSFAKPGTVNG